LNQDGQTSAVVNMLPWLSRTALDAIGISEDDLVMHPMNDANLYLQRDLTISSEQLTMAVPENSPKSTTTSCPSPSASASIYAHITNSHSVDVFSNRSDWVIAFDSLWDRFPEWLLPRIPTKRMKRLRSYMNASEEVGQTLIDRQVASHTQGKEGSKDIMSILSKSLFPQFSQWCRHVLIEVIVIFFPLV
jgi:hypothetical protein